VICGTLLKLSLYGLGSSTESEERDFDSESLFSIEILGTPLISYFLLDYSLFSLLIYFYFYLSVFCLSRSNSPKLSVLAFEFGIFKGISAYFGLFSD
jgi:hypothetical protein